MYQLPLQGDLQGLQSAVASWADLEDTRGAEAACRGLLRQADERALLRGSNSDRPLPDGDIVVEPVADIVHPELNVLHVAAALGSAALVEYIWQVCCRFCFPDKLQRAYFFREFVLLNRSDGRVSCLTASCRALLRYTEGVLCGRVVHGSVTDTEATSVAMCESQSPMSA
jgi:hypothetical protein